VWAVGVVRLSATDALDISQGTVDASAVSSIWDLMNPQYTARVGSSQPKDTTQIMAYKTLCLLHKATS
jgi:hypothetical protein